LITSFIGNINNFNVIFFLTGGGPTMGTLEAGKTDLLVTWLYKLTVTKNYFNLASVIGILTFIFCATVGLILYSNSKSVKDEEAFM
jgi:arabinogalactan oligomer/maltooligosaccharide transport system permease protein